MPIRKTTKAAKAREAKLPTIPAELIDQLVQGPMTAQSIREASMALKKAVNIRCPTTLGADRSGVRGGSFVANSTGALMTASPWECWRENSMVLMDQSQ